MIPRNHGRIDSSNISNGHISRTTSSIVVLMHFNNKYYEQEYFDISE